MTGCRFVRTLAMVICGGFLLSAPLVGQVSDRRPKLKQRSNSETLIFKKMVRRVLVDVVVEDAHGRHVPGLTAKDFSIFEDKKQQTILSFDVHNFEPSISLPPNSPPLPPNTFMNVPRTPERGPLNVLLLDAMNMGGEDWMYARQEVLKFIDSKPEGSRFAIFVNSDRLYMVQGFTADRNTLREAVTWDRPGRPHLPRLFLNRFLGGPSGAEVLDTLSQYLEGIPGRKNLIWLCGWFPVPIYPAAYATPADVEVSKRMLADVTRAQIALYPVDVRGVVVGASVVIAPPLAGLPMWMHPPSNSLLPFQYAAEDSVASLTGGHAYYSGNYIHEGIAISAEHGSNYYTLSYAPSNKEDDNRRHYIEVTCSKQRYYLSYRKFYDSYFSVTHHSAQSIDPIVSPADVLQEPGDAILPKSTLRDNMWHGAPEAHDLIFKARIRAIGSPEAPTAERIAQFAEQPAYSHKQTKERAKELAAIKVQHYQIYYLVAARQVQARKGEPLPLAFHAVAFDVDGVPMNGILQRADRQDSEKETGIRIGTEDAGPGRDRAYLAMQELDVPVNAAWLRLGVWNTSKDLLGTLEIHLPLAPEPQSHIPFASAF